MMRSRILFLAIVLALAGAKSDAQSVPDTLRRYLTAAAADGQINGSVLIGQNGRILCQTNFGFADLDKKTPITDDTLFPLASISKSFTAVAVLQLKERGKLQLDDPLSKYLTNFPYPTITIRQLLSHTSGLPDTDAIFGPLVAADTNRLFGLADVMPALIAYYGTNHALLFTPGERWSYCSLGYSLLAILTQQLSGMPFADYAEKNIFSPAGMNHSYFQTNVAQAAESNRTVNYLYNNHYEMKLQRADTLADNREWTYSLVGLLGGGGVISSTSDLFRFDQALYGGVLLKAETIEEAYTPVKVNNGKNNHAVSGTAYGLGWFINDDTSRGKIVWHSGSTPGVVTLFVRNLGAKECYAVLLNVACSMGVYHDVLDIIKGQTILYRPSLAFLYGHDLFSHGIEYATCHLNELKDDTADYSLKESEIDRIGLEFSRVNKLGNLSREAYKINTFLFPTSWQAYANYGDVIRTQTKDKAAAMMAYRKALSLDPTNDVVQKKLDDLSKK